MTQTGINRTKRDGAETNGLLSRRSIRCALLGLIALGALSLVAAGSAAAQSEDDPSSDVEVNVCEDAGALAGIANAVIQLSIYGGGAGVAVTYFMTSAGETLPIGPETMEKLRSYRSQAFGGAIKLLAAGPVLWIIIQAANLPWAGCIELNPFF